MKSYVMRGVGYSFIGLLLFSFGCKGLLSKSGGQTIVVTGHVIDKTSGQPINNAVVRTVSPPPEIDEVTDSTGAFTLKLKIDSTESYKIEAQKEGYYVYTTTVLAVPGRNVNLPDLMLQTQDSTSTTGGGTANSNRTSGYAASIMLSSVSSNSIVVKESGGNESSELDFVVQDSSGIPVDLNHAATINFKFGSAPGGGETLNPLQAKTNENGEAVTTLTSGTKAGVVQVVAQATVNGNVIQSKPVPISIDSGLPDQSHFTLAANQYNIPFPDIGKRYKFTCFAGDKYGNVVTQGVSVYFTTNGGYIEGSATTGTDGSASVNLTDGNPYPPNGIASIIATTADENFNTVTDTVKVIFSEGPIITISPTSFNIPNGGSQTFNYTVMDNKGYPMAIGTSVSVNVEGQNIKTAGDIGPAITDVAPDFSNINQLTNFSFSINDSQPDTAVSVPVYITIESNGPNGNAKVKITGTSN
jgi:hypothetical protein